MTTPMLGLRTVIHPVADLVGAKTWFTALLGFGPYFDEPFYRRFEVAGYELGLLPGADPTDGALRLLGCRRRRRRGGRRGRRWCDGAHRRRRGGRRYRTATVRSPQGAIVGFIVNPHFGGS
jgi:hypothetical protein